MQALLLNLLPLAGLVSVTLASYGGYGGGNGPYNYGYGYSGLAFPYIPYGYHGAKFLTEVKAAKLRGALYDGHPSRYAQFGGHGYVGYPSKSKLDYSLNGIPNAGYGPGYGPSFFDGRSNIAAGAKAGEAAAAPIAPVAADDARTAVAVEAPLVDAVDNTNGGGPVNAAASLAASSNNIGVVPPYATIPNGRTNAYALDRATAMGLDAQNGGEAAVGVPALEARQQQQVQQQTLQQQQQQQQAAPMGGGYGGKIDPYALYSRYMGPYNGGYAQQKTAFGPSGQAYY